MIEIFTAHAEDVEWLVGELREFDRFYQTKKRLFGDEKVVREKMLEIVNSHVCFIAEKTEEDGNSKRIGFIAGILRPHFYNPDLRVLSQLFWWVLPTERKTLAASMLMDAFILIGKQHADWITFNMSPWTPVKERSFLRKGFSVSDRVYLLEIE